MERSSVAGALVTIVVVPRDHFSMACEALDSIIADTTIPYKLVYVDGNSPRRVRAYIESKAKEHGFDIIRREAYLSPNQARNIGLDQVETEYVCFIDNDVAVSPGWLDALLACAEETGADVVGPLTAQHKPLHTEIHSAVCEAAIVENEKDGAVERVMVDKIHDQGKRVDAMQPGYERTPMTAAEFHCMFVRRSLFEKTGPLDEGFLNTREHVDFGLTVIQAGGSIYFEPKSLVTFVPGPPLAWSDLPFFMLRWSDDWERASLHHLRDKWNLTENAYFQNRYKNLGWRRRMTLIRPFIEKLPLPRGKYRVEKVVARLERAFNRMLVRRHAQRAGITLRVTSPREKRATPPG